MFTSQSKVTMSMNIEILRNIIGKADVYLLDQIMKGIYTQTDKILDAGCGHGRHISLFEKLELDIYGIDINKERIHHCKQEFPKISKKFQVSDLKQIPFDDGFFEHVISSAVFHFATSKAHFKCLFAEHIRVMKIGGTLFIRMTSQFGLAPKSLRIVEEGIYVLPDGTQRFLISYSLVKELQEEFHLKLIEPIKTVNVSDERAMAVLMFQKLK